MSPPGRGDCGRVARQAGAPGPCAVTDGAPPTIQRVAAVEASFGAARSSNASVPLPAAASEPPHRDVVDSTGTHFTDHRIDGAAAQCFFHCPQQVATCAVNSTNRSGARPKASRPGPWGTRFSSSAMTSEIQNA